MNCSAVRALAGAYALDALPDPERRLVERHLDRCPECRALIAALSDTAASLAVLAPLQAPPAGMKERILSAALKPDVVARRHRLPRTWRPTVRAAAALALLVLGWTAGRMAPAQHAGPSRNAGDELTRVRLERDLWQALSPPGAAVMALSTDASVPRAVAFASVLGDERGCWVRLVAEGLPEPPPGMRYAVWVSTLQGELRSAGQLGRASSGRWELLFRIDTPPARLDTLRVLLQGAGTDDPGAGRQVAWGQLWPDGPDW